MTKKIKKSIIDLDKCFETALKEKYKYIAIFIETKGSKGLELIINPYENFVTKWQYYLSSYNFDLTLKNAPQIIKIVDFKYFNDFGDLENND